MTSSAGSSLDSLFTAWYVGTDLHKHLGIPASDGCTGRYKTVQVSTRTGTGQYMTVQDSAGIPLILYVQDNTGQYTSVQDFLHGTY